MNTFVKLTLLTLFALVYVQPSGAAQRVVVDQTSPVGEPIPFTFALGGDGGQVLYQSFTVGTTGRLAEIALPIGCASGQVTLQIFPADPSGLPVVGATALLTRVFPVNMFPEIVVASFQTLGLGARVAVTAGDYLVFVLSNPEGSCGIAPGLPGDGYTDGTGHATDAVNNFPVPLNLSTPGNPDDLGFQTSVLIVGPPTP